MTSLVEEEQLRGAGKTEDGMVEGLMHSIFDRLPEDYRVEKLESRNISWECDCSMERLENVLMTIGKKDLKEIIDEDGQAELVCQFCRKKYFFDKEQLLKIYDAI